MRYFKFLTQRKLDFYGNIDSNRIANKLVKYQFYTGNYEHTIFPKSFFGTFGEYEILYIIRNNDYYTSEVIYKPYEEDSQTHYRIEDFI